MIMRNIAILYIVDSLILISCINKIKNENYDSFKDNFFAGIDTILDNSGISVDTNAKLKFFIDTSINLKLYPEFDKVTLNRYFHKIDWESFLTFKKPCTNFLFVIVDSLNPLQGYNRLVVLERRFHPTIDIQPYFALYLITMRNDSFVSSFLVANHLLLNNQRITHGSMLFSDTLLVSRKVEIISFDVQELRLMQSSNFLVKQITTDLLSYDKKNGLFTLLRRYSNKTVIK